MQTLPMLFKSNSKGTLQQWKIWTEGNRIITEFGQVEGKLQTTEDVIKVGKNLGRANATTPEQQAESEALSKWEKQKTKKGYVEDLARAVAAENDLKGDECMLAHPYGTLENGIFVPDQNHKIKFPCFVQPKLDGHRCRVGVDCSLWSRGHRQIEQMPHIVKELSEIFYTDLAPKLDGELYNHELKEDFEKLTSILRQQKQVHPEHRLIQYHIYDVDLPGVPFVERHEFLKQIARNSEFLRLVETRIANNHAEVLAAYEDFVSQGYEGAIIRNMAAEYEGKRSYNLQKLKGFRDQEFKIVGIKEGKGKLMGHAATFSCVTADGKDFEVKLEGSISHLKEYFEDHSLWKGRQMTVRFQSWTRKGVPRIPVGLRVRWDL